jgi:hypothetical protein
MTGLNQTLRQAHTVLVKTQMRVLAPKTGYCWQLIDWLIQKEIYMECLWKGYLQDFYRTRMSHAKLQGVSASALIAKLANHGS